MPRSATRTIASGPSCAIVTLIWPPSSWNFAALLSRFATTWVSRTRSPETRTAVSGTLEGEIVPSGLDQRPAGLDPRTHHRDEIERLRLELDLPARDPGDVEQIVDEPGQLIDLSLDQIPAPGGFGRESAFGACRSTSAFRIGASGFRSSCASTARNSSLRRSLSRSSAVDASSSSVRRATRSSRSAFRRSSCTRLAEQIREHAHLRAQHLRAPPARARSRPRPSRSRAADRARSGGPRRRR